jgi:hypothetical protein
LGQQKCWKGIGWMKTLHLNGSMKATGRSGMIVSVNGCLINHTAGKREKWTKKRGGCVGRVGCVALWF